MKKILAIVFVFIFILANLIGCSSKPFGNDSAPAPQQSYDGGVKDGDYGYNSSSGESVARNDSVSAPEMDSKIIKVGYLSVETLNFDETTSAVTRRVQTIGGYVASSNIQGVSNNQKTNAPMRRAHFKVRIPSHAFDQFLTDVGDLGNVTRSESSGQNVSAQYFDTEARVRSLKIQEDRLLSILQQAEKLQDILELERELSRVRYDIENLTGTLKKWDNLVQYSTVDIDVYEVTEIKKVEAQPVTLWEKIVNGFNTSLEVALRILQFMLIFIISAVPFLVLFGTIALLAYIILKFIKKFKK